jgi:hypothetical protein
VANMAQNLYSNLPPAQNPIATNATIQAFDNYYSKPLELDANTFNAVKAFFGSRGFGDSSAETAAVIIIKQAKKDGYNVMQLIDTLHGVSDIQLSEIIAEILNYNRLNTSFLGYAQKFVPNPEIIRNIVA